MPADAEFDRDLALAETSPGVYDAELRPGWVVGGAINGGFLLYSGTNIPHLYGEVQALLTKDSALNATGYSSDTVTTWLTKAMDAKDQNEFTSDVQQASKAGLADMPLAPLYYPVGGLLHAKTLSNVYPELLGGADLAAVTVAG